MSFRLSRCVGLCARDPGEAVAWYEDSLSMERGPTGSDGMQVRMGLLHFYVDPGRPTQPVLELLTDNLELARAEAQRMGFREVCWNGIDKLNMVVDQFGVKWNVYHSPVVGDEEGMGEAVTGLGRIGIHWHQPELAAEFYSSLLGEAATLAQDAWIIDSGLVRLKIERGLPSGPVFYLPSEFDMRGIGAKNRQSVFTDKFGVTWKSQPGPKSSRAVVERG